MRNSYNLWIGVAGLMLFASVGIAQDRNPDLRQRVEAVRARAGQNRFAAWIRPRLDGVVQQTSENAAERYGLTETAAKGLRQAIAKTANMAVTDSSGMRTIGTAARMNDHGAVLLAILSPPAGETALAQHLTEQQVQDFLAFAQARADLEAEAVADQLVAWADRHLSLRPDQGAKIRQKLVAGPGKEWHGLQALLWMDSDEFVAFLSPVTVDSGDLEEVLSAAQARIWGLLTRQMNDQRGNLEAAKREFRGEEAEKNDARDEPDPRLIRYRRAEAALNQVVEAGRITREQANARLIALRERLWSEDSVTRRAGRDSDSENLDRQLAEAKLTAHTEQLGELDDRAKKRLALVSKGVVEQYVESRLDGRQTNDRRDPTRDPDVRFEEGAIRIREAVAAGRITREQAAARLSAMRGEMAQDEALPLPRPTGGDITGHPLYQQTIKDVLSEETYTEYQKRQAERSTFREQALRALAMAWLDTHLLLSDTQRKRSEAIVAQLPVDTSGPGAAVANQLAAQLDRNSLTEWQGKILKEITREFEGWEDDDRNIPGRR